MAHTLRVEVQYIDGDIQVYERVTEDYWSKVLYPALDTNEEVWNFTVSTNVEEEWCWI